MLSAVQKNFFFGGEGVILQEDLQIYSD